MLCFQWFCSLRVFIEEQIVFLYTKVPSIHENHNTMQDNETPILLE